MIIYYRKIPAWLITVITLIVVIAMGYLTYMVIGLISGIIDSFFG